MGNTLTRGLSALPRLLMAGMFGLVALGNFPVFGQGFSQTITGTVKDPSGASLPGAAITVKQLETGLTRTAQSDTSGNFTVPSLPVGAYEVTVEKMGFRKELRQGISLAVAQEAQVDVTLQVGSIDQQVTVTGEAPLVNTTVSSTAGLITESQVKDLPLNGRSFDQLIMLNVGTSNASSNTLNNSSWGVYSVAGKRPETNRYILNGVDWIGGNAPGSFIVPFGSSQQLLGVEAVREFNVLSDTYGAEFGKRAGGQIDIVTSSGTNGLHGDVFEFWRNSALAARNFEDHTIGTPPFNRNQFGGTLGGPIKKDKLFVFGNYEAYRQALAFPSTAVVPSANARLGLMPNGSPVPGLNKAILPYANAFWPAPNTPDLGNGTAIAYSNPPQHIHEDFGLVRLDYNISNNDSISAHYNYDDGFRNQPFVDPAFSNNSTTSSQTISIRETHVFSPNLVNIATAGLARSNATLVNVPLTSIPSNLVFMPGGNPGSIIIGGGVITASPSAVAAAGGNNPTVGVRNYFTENDDVRWTKGKHSFSFGGWVQRIQQNLAGQAQGSAVNVAYPTVLAFLQDKPSQAIVVRNPAMVGYRSFEAAWYVQDEIKLRSNLTMRIGLRDEMTNGWNEVAGRCSNYFYDAFVIQTNPHIGNSCLAQNNALALWQPRLGIAWDPTGTGTWAIRASAGIHNDLLDALGQKAFNNPPFSAREQLTIPAAGFLALLPVNKTAPTPPTCDAGLVAAKTPCSIYQPGGFDPNMFTPTIQMWTFTVERQLTKNLMLSVGYVGSQSYHTNLTMDTNSSRPQLCQDPKGCLSGGVQTNGRPYGILANGKPDPNQPPVFAPQGVLYLPPATRPNPFVSNNATYYDEGTSNYNALNVSLVKRVTHGLAFKANYSWSKVMDLNSAALAVTGENEPADVFSPYNLAMNRGPAAYSLHHQFNANFSYQLPFGKGQPFGGGATGWLNQLIGGWQWNGIFTAQGGFPVTPLTGSNNSGTGDTNISDVPNWNPNFKGPVILKDPNHWFDPHAFLLPTTGTFGNVSRGSLVGPGLVTVDTSFFKKFTVSERVSVQLRAEAFNIFNHSNFFYPNAIVFQGKDYSDTAGQVTAAAAPRQLQFALKLIF
jgi:carboxypeptidase family protein